MPRCTVCQHPDHTAINLKLVGGESTRAIALAYAGVSKSSVATHARKHVSQTIARGRAVKAYAKTLPPEIEAAAIELPEVEEADRLFESLEYVEAKAREFLDQAFADRKPTAQAAALREAREAVILRARLEGRLSPVAAEAMSVDARTQTVNVVNILSSLSPDHLRALMAKQLA